MIIPIVIRGIAIVANPANKRQRLARRVVVDLFIAIKMIAQALKPIILLFAT